MRGLGVALIAAATTVLIAGATVARKRRGHRLTRPSSIGHGQFFWSPVQPSDEIRSWAVIGTGQQSAPPSGDGFHIRLPGFLRRRSQVPQEPVLPPTLPLLEHVGSLEETEWLRSSITYESEGLGRFLPGTFEAYAKLFHPIACNDGSGTPPPTWGELSLSDDADLDAIFARDEMLESLLRRGHVRHGSLPTALIDALIPHLRSATTTPDKCFFAVWIGFGALAVPGMLQPMLDLPTGDYHVFSGPIDAARTSYSLFTIRHQSANLMWPADHAWCVATEIDLAWTYLGGSRRLIDSVLADPRLESREVSVTVDL